MPEPRIIMQDTGIHNERIEESATRVLRSGSWKKQRIITVLPSATTIPARVALAHWNLAFPPNNGVMKILALGMEVGEAYSTAISSILAHPELSKWEYVLTIEHDNAPPVNGVLLLTERMENNPHLAAVSGLYWTKGETGVPQIWGDPADVLNFRPQAPKAGELVECCGIGMGFALWRLETFKDSRLRKPWFKTMTGIEGTGVGTQDLYFWGDARQYGYRCAVDCNVLVGHYDLESDTMW